MRYPAYVILAIMGSGVAMIAACTDGKPTSSADLDPALKKYTSGAKRSGYIFAEPETRAIQDDDFNNPAFFWIDKGKEMWSKAEGDAGKSCASCHGEAEKSMKGVGATYPKFYAPKGKLVNLEQRINICRTEEMKAKDWKYESNELLSMTGFVKMQSRGMPVNVAVDGPAKPFFEKGKALYYERRGLNDLACKHCHEDHGGNYIRAELLSQGQSNGFPTYRLKWQKFGSLHRRMAGCNEEIRAEPFPLGSDEYVNLELYAAWRGNGLAVETPSVRK
jgi:sulfur-oxidizing protein SoxA